MNNASKSNSFSLSPLSLVFLCVLNIVVFVVNGCSSTPHQTAHLSEGLGGAGAPEEGLGGTGLSPVDEGLGGTGQMAEGLGGTGIVGEVTGFGSIWVHNAHVHYDDNTQVSFNQTLGKVEDIQLGHVVSISSTELRPSGKNQESEYQANHIDVVFEVVGPIAGITQNAKHISKLQILNQTVHISDKTRLATDSGLAEQQWVAVSGFRKSNGTINATRIEPAVKTAATIGRIQFTEQKGYSINDVALKLDPWLVPEDLSKRYLVQGDLTADQIITVTSVGLDSIETLLNESIEILVEGYLYELDDDLIIGGFEFDLPDSFDLPEGMDFDETIHIEADLIDDEFIIEDFFVIPEGLEDYEDMLPEIDFPEWEDDVEPEFELEDIEIDEFEHFEDEEGFEFDEFDEFEEFVIEEEFDDELEEEAIDPHDF